MRYRDPQKSKALVMLPDYYRIVRTGETCWTPLHLLTLPERVRITKRLLAKAEKLEHMAKVLREHADKVSAAPRPRPDLRIVEAPDA
jgi:hypothetical protein